jgi:hypothetical protein
VGQHGCGEDRDVRAFTRHIGFRCQRVSTAWMPQRLQEVGRREAFRRIARPKSFDRYAAREVYSRLVGCATEELSSANDFSSFE